MEVVLEIISQNGTNNVTVRQIAEKAEVNVASINYHFGSKENLIKISMNYFIKKMNYCFSVLEDETISLEERVNKFCKQYSDNLARNPGVIKSLLSELMHNDTIKPGLQESMSRGFKLLVNVVKGIKDLDNETEARYMAFIIMSSLVYPVLYDKHLESLFGFEFEKQVYREDYINLLLGNMIGR